MATTTSPNNNDMDTTLSQQNTDTVVVNVDFSTVGTGGGGGILGMQHNNYHPQMSLWEQQQQEQPVPLKRRRRTINSTEIVVTTRHHTLEAAIPPPPTSSCQTVKLPVENVNGLSNKVVQMIYDIIHDGHVLFYDRVFVPVSTATLLDIRDAIVQVNSVWKRFPVTTGIELIPYAFSHDKTTLSSRPLDLNVVYDAEKHGGTSSKTPITFFIKKVPPYVPGSDSAQKAGQSYVDALLSPDAIEDVGTAGGMRVICNLPTSMSGEGQPSANVIIRHVTEPFWNACINICERPHLNHRVCVVGNPGIGKSASTHYLIRMLLLRNKTVVYLVRTRSLSSWYYEFVPQPDNPVQPYACNVYKETRYPDPYAIPSLQDRSTYYIVDAGDTTDSCALGGTFESRLIIVASPLEDHWGGSQFFKIRHDFGAVHGGILLYYPLWSLEELLLAKTYMSNNIAHDLPPQDATIEHRYNQVGGVPRHIFADEIGYSAALKNQDLAIAQMSREQAISIIRNRPISAVGMFGLDSLRSAILGYRYESVPDPLHPFDTENVRVLSARIAKQVYLKYMGMKPRWNEEQNL